MPEEGVPVKATLVPAVCAAVILYCSWMLDRSRSLALATTDTVEVTVRGPDGQIIKPIKRAQ
jgi:hypothetical protein